MTYYKFITTPATDRHWFNPSFQTGSECQKVEDFSQKIMKT